MSRLKKSSAFAGLVMFALLAFVGPAAADNSTVLGEGDLDRAVAAYSESIRIAPGNAAVYVARGFVYAEKGDRARAIADFSEAIRLDPRLGVAYVSRGSAYRDNGDISRAIADFGEAIRIDPKDASAFTNRGLTYRKIGDLAKARADFDAALALPRDLSDGWPQDTALIQLGAMPGPSLR